MAAPERTILGAPGGSPRCCVLRVSCADKLHNARCLLVDYWKVRDSLWQRFRTKSRDDQLWCYRELCRVFSKSQVGYLADELNRTVRALEDSIYADSVLRQSARG